MIECKTVTLALRRPLVALLVVLTLRVEGAHAEPISVDRYGKGAPLYLLDTRGAIFKSTADQPLVPSLRFSELPKDLEGNEILATKIFGDKELVFVSANSRVQHGPDGLLLEYAPTGEVLALLALPPIGGLDIDPSTHSIYLTSTYSNSIVKVDVAPTGTVLSLTQWVVRLPPDGRLGPIVFDEGAHRLFVANVLNGDVWSVDLNTRQAKHLAKVEGQPVALAYASASKVLYVADPANRSIWSLAIGDSLDSTTSFRRFSGDAALSEPISLALLDDGGLIVADRRLNSLLKLDPHGQVEATIPLASAVAGAKGFICDTPFVNASLDWCSRDHGPNEGGVCGLQALSGAGLTGLPALALGNTWDRTKMMEAAKVTARAGQKDAAANAAICCQVHNPPVHDCLAGQRSAVINWLMQ